MTTPNIRVLLEIGCVFPVTSSEAERSFSVLRRLKTYIRNRMGEDRLASLALLHTNHKIEMLSSDILERFIMKHHDDYLNLCMLTSFMCCAS